CELKSAAFEPEELEDHILITADTIVAVDDLILGKPSDAAEAKKMLNLLSGRSHEVITAFCLRGKNKKIVRSVTTKVVFKSLSKKEIDYYVTNFKPFDKAGAYGIQEWIGLIGI